MARPLDVCIRGGGIVGHALALLLARERLRVGLVARPPASGAPVPDVRAYALNHQSRDLLEQLRCWPDPKHATPVLSMQIREGGAGAVNFSAAESGVPALTWIVDVPALEAQLSEALRFQPHVELIDSPQAATLTVVCEGQASESRQQLGAELDVVAYPHWAIAARVVCEQAHGQAACQWFTPDDVLGFLPLDGDYGNSMAIVWSVTQERKTALLEMDPAEFTAQLQAASHNRFGALSLSSARAAWPLRLAVARNWSGVSQGQAWVLAGDAAHAVHPLAGQGMNPGFADVDALLAVLAQRDEQSDCGDMRTLGRYARARKEEVMLMRIATDGLQRLFASDLAPLRLLRNAGLGLVDRLPFLKRRLITHAMGKANPHTFE